MTTLIDPASSRSSSSDRFTASGNDAPDSSKTRLEFLAQPSGVRGQFVAGGHRHRMWHDDVNARNIVEDPTQLGGDVVGRSDEREALGDLAVEKVDEPTGSDEIGGMMEIGPDAAFELLHRRAVPYEAGRVEQRRCVLVEAGRHGARDRSDVCRILATAGVHDQPECDLRAIAPGL